VVIICDGVALSYTKLHSPFTYPIWLVNYVWFGLAWVVVTSLNGSVSVILFCRYLIHLYMVALLLVVYVGYTIYVVRVLFIITISIDYNRRSAAISTYIIGNRLKLSRMRSSYYVRNYYWIGLYWCGDYSLRNRNNRIRSYWNRYIKGSTTNIGWIYRLGYDTYHIVEGLKIYSQIDEQSLRPINEEGNGQSEVEKVLWITLVGDIE